MGDIINGVASEYEMPRTPKFYNNENTSVAGLPQTKTIIPMPPVKPIRDQMCEFCAKEDVCCYKDEQTKAYKDILEIEGRTNVFINTTVNCKKFLRKTESNGIR